MTLAASIFALIIAFTMAGACGGNAVLDSGTGAPGKPDGAAVRDAASERPSKPPSGRCGNGVLDAHLGM